MSRVALVAVVAAFGCGSPLAGTWTGHGTATIDCANGSDSVDPASLSWTVEADATLKTGGYCDPIDMAANSAGGLNITPKACQPLTLNGNSVGVKCVGGVLEADGDARIQYELKPSGDTCLLTISGTLSRQ